MKGTEFKVGDIVGFKGRGFGFGRITSIGVGNPINLRGKAYPLYHIEILSGNTMVAAYGEHIENLSPEDLDLVGALDSIGNL